jgi:hypothetical protein
LAFPRTIAALLEEAEFQRNDYGSEREGQHQPASTSIPDVFSCAVASEAEAQGAAPYPFGTMLPPSRHSDSYYRRTLSPGGGAGNPE